MSSFNSIHQKFLWLIVLIAISIWGISSQRNNLSDEFLTKLGKLRSQQTPTIDFQVDKETPILDFPDDMPQKYQFHLLHIVLKDSTESLLVNQSYIQDQIQNVNDWFYAQTNGSSFRFDTYQNRLDITQIVLPLTNEEFLKYTNEKYEKNDPNFNGLVYLNKALEDWLQIVDRNAPYLVPGKIYLAYFEVSEAYVCGHAPLPGNRVIGIYPLAINLRDNSPCAAFLGGNIPNEGTVWVHLLIHEILHSLGFPTDCAKNIIPETHHIGDSVFPNDIMGVSPGLYDLKPVLDPNHDDYYKTDFDCPDLANSPFLDPLPQNPQLPENVLSNPYWRLENIGK